MLTYRRDYLVLVGYAHEIGLHVRSVRRIPLPDFVGFNSMAAQEFGIKMSSNTIDLLRDSVIKVKRHTLGHELIEFLLMKFRRKRYGVAHRVALRWERKPVKDIIGYCNKVIGGAQ